MIKRLINKCFDMMGYKIVSKGYYQEIPHTIRNPEEQMGFFLWTTLMQPGYCIFITIVNEVPAALFPNH